ncbi:MAG: magnesium/cobalt transporter CorA [Chloroflexota bacterium]|nr:magnesium/cobalt transporter CorA [Chloroflexota bacterium]
MQQQLFVWQQGKLNTDESITNLHTVLQDPQALIWLDIKIEGDALKCASMLTSVFNLSHLTLDTIEEEKERARLVRGHSYFHLVVHGLDFDPQTSEASTPKLDIVFGKNFIATLHRSRLPWLDEVSESIRNDDSEENIMSQGMSFLLHDILDTLVDSYFPVLDTLDDLIDDLEDATVNEASNEVQARLFRIKRSLAQMRRVISPQVEVTNALITRTGDLIPTEAEPYFADVHDHLVRTFEVLDSYRDLMSGLLDVYLTTVSNRLNQVMKQLTIIATIFMPITFITGVFGQNFGHSPQVEHDAGYNFWIILAVMGLITLGQILYFKYRKWI